jgi:hypothetical protein
MKPEIATILDNGEYGQREMTEQEHANYLEQIETQEQIPKIADNETPSPA